MDQIKQKLRDATAILDPYAKEIPQLVELAKQLDVNEGLLLGAMLSVVVLITVFLMGWTILTCFITVLFPMFKSIQAIQSDGDDDDKEWLTYWMVFGVFRVVDMFFNWLFVWLLDPYWAFIELGFFFYLMAPQFKGALTIYKSVLKPILDANKDKIQDLIKQTTSQAEAMKNQAANEAMKAASDPNVLLKGTKLMAEAQAAASNMAEDNQEHKE
eukprot:CAMPEP_0176348208 /NCGR_PEP_ID=MMETSP0126-20121128/7676_1 /TAXON_ID=141414 ORGANISM="Strombidinopsis acuminatum, Strain SPMC142" /NCGR_SAMPLE_ID=MMETSP0126 /ASSEMBLY_ACC=CAM_ASM_000229 /LENGTH=213 /DNA_ID=CAMNT_0017696851 /DNA_START=53 /DNA_END=694 /DNA_ORIENTATION=-